MSRGLNKVMIIGNLGRDPEMRYTPNQKAVTNFNVAASRSWKSAEGERRTETEWFNVVAWGKLAEICNQFLVKGQQVYIEGRLQTRKWEDDDGNRRSTVEIHAREMVMLGRNRKNEDTDSDDVDSPDDFLDDSENEFPF